MLLEILVLVVTIVLAMIETAAWPTVFFYLTILCVILLNMANGVYQNTVYGLAARLPARYTGAVVLGSVSISKLDYLGHDPIIPRHVSNLCKCLCSSVAEF